MKTQHILAVAGGLFVIVSTVVPAHNTNMWGALKLIDSIFMIGALPLVMCLAGLVGILTGFMRNSMVALICGAFAFIWMVAAFRFQFYILLTQSFLLVALLGSVMMIIGGSIGLTSQPSKGNTLDN